ncbi:MAG: glycosyltransferase family 4 protein, partial [Acidobacteria bacterium]|nr:glycosyltransferase family 4 protein [Acidobacteriota bacterium]
TIHDLICFAYPSQHGAQYYFFRYVLPLILRSCRKVVTVSNFTRGEVLSVFSISNTDVVTVHNGGDHLQTAGNSRSEPAEFIGLNSTPYFLIVGCSYPHKNVERAIEAFTGIEQDCRLVILAGQNGYTDDLKKRFSAEENIVFLDFVAGADLSRLYKDAVAHVYVSRYEGFGLPPLEAALNGTVSIVSNTTALPEVYGTSVVYVDPESVEQISVAMLGLLTGKIDRQAYRKEFPALFSKYRWDNSARRVAEIILET